ncbi:glycosyltransferase [Belliella sp. DSM 111904]|uniref:Glycosyltransferase n=1 Tax=Belliella filtrata TaxID=2923435 RepID=A0ABS9UZT2_9BACT|nr:glycosyltransferase [Belliella filtrata]MCH7409687.1 glycosyltransferase [Belliella filtrata]
MNMITFSVIIPTYHEWDRLQLCLNSLEAQSFNLDDFEIIVVNNDPEDFPPKNLRLPYNCILLKEEKVGSYAARNTAIKASKGKILAFTDSDCICDKDWLSNAFMRLRDSNKRLAGHVELFFESKNISSIELFEKAFSFDQKFNAERGTSVTANMITWKSSFERVGLFDESLLSGGDIDWGWRAHRNGLDVEYARDVLVNHPARSNMKMMLKKKRRVAGGEILIEKNSFILTFLKIIIIGFLPPFSLKKLFKIKNMTFFQKIKAGYVAYFLKIYGTIFKLGILFNLTDHQRA